MTGLKELETFQCVNCLSANDGNKIADLFFKIHLSILMLFLGETLKFYEQFGQFVEMAKKIPLEGPMSEMLAQCKHSYRLSYPAFR